MLPEGYVLEREKKLMKEQQREMEGDEYTIDDYVEEQVFYSQNFVKTFANFEFFTQFLIKNV